MTVGRAARLLDGTADRPGRDVDAPRRDVRRHHAAPLRQRHAGRAARSPARSLTSTSPAEIGGNSIWPEWFHGLIDEVRIYNRALTAAEITDGHEHVDQRPRHDAPSAPGTLTATGGLGQVGLSWAAATDNVGVVRYNVHRRTDRRLHADHREPDRAADRHELHRQRARGRHLLLQGHRRGRRGQHRAGLATRPAAPRRRDTTPPHRAHPGCTATGTAGQSRWLEAAATTRAASPGTTSTARRPPASRRRAANRIAQPTTTLHRCRPRRRATYYYRSRPRTTPGNVGRGLEPGERDGLDRRRRPGSSPHTASTQGAGTTVRRSSGNGNNGTLTDATWQARPGKYGGALSFNGTNASSTCPTRTRSTSRRGMTLEALGQAHGASAAWRTVIVKERPGNLVYGLYGEHGHEPAAVADHRRRHRAPARRHRRGPGRARGRTWPPPSTARRCAVRQRHAGRELAVRRRDHDLDRRAEDRRQLDLGRVVQRPDRRGADLQPRAQRRRDPGRHERARRQPRHDAAERARHAHRDRAELGAQLSWSAATDNVGVVRYNVHRSTTAGSRRRSRTGSRSRRARVHGHGRSRRRTTTGSRPRTPPATSAPPRTRRAPIVGDTVGPVGAGQAQRDRRARLSRRSRWVAATDNVGVVRYNVHRATTAGFIPGAGEPDRAADRDELHRHRARAGTYFYRVTAEDAAGNVGAGANEASGDSDARHAGADRARQRSRDRSRQHGRPQLDGLDRQRGVTRYNVHRSTTPGFTPTAANRIAQPTGTSYADRGLATGTYYYRVTAEDAAGNIERASNEASAVDRRRRPRRPRPAV